MDKHVRDVLEKLKAGRLSLEGAFEKLRNLPYEDMGFAMVDHHRAMRQGIPEVVLSEGKRPEETVAIAKALYKKNKRVFITRANAAIHKKLGIKGAVLGKASGVIYAGEEKKKSGCVLVVSAGTSDIPVAEEAALTASFLGSKVKTLYDVGVAGIHRLMHRRAELELARVVIVAAGMEGALPSVVGGITDKPIVAVPTSVGYGTSLGGFAAMFAMLNSCVPGIAVMNIDNGFGAGCLAHKINTLK